MSKSHLILLKMQDHFFSGSERAFAFSRQWLAVYAQVKTLPAFARKHQAAGEIPASAAGREGFGFGEFQGVSLT